MAKKYVKSYSNYIIKKSPLPTESGTIYENDLPTTGPDTNYVNGNRIEKTPGGFIFAVNDSPVEIKAYNTTSVSGDTYTLSDVNFKISDLQSINGLGSSFLLKEQKFVELNKTYDDFSKICYFGSTNAMLKSAIEGIINNFPAGLYVRNYQTSTISDTYITIPIEDIENNFNIDITDYKDILTNLPQSDLRVFHSSYLDFQLVLSNETIIGDVIGFTGYTEQLNPTGITFQISGQTLTNSSEFHIRPKRSKFDEFVLTLDDFQRMLLNERTTPKYKTTLKIPVETETGIRYDFNTFIWATSDNYNLDIQSADYVYFLESLINSSNLIDELYSDNLYRMLTHETIKNFDSGIISREIDEFRAEEIAIGGTKITNLLRLYGRSFDELKKYIEGINTANNITYDGVNNLPNTYFDGKLNESGWDTFTILNNFSNTGVTNNNMFMGLSGNYSVKEVDVELNKRLILNSKHILRSKGTRKSIRRLLGLFGVKESWYEMREFVQSVDSFLTGDSLYNIAELNYAIYPEDNITQENKEDYVFSFDQTLYDNTNIGLSAKCPICDSENYITTGDTIVSGICVENNHIFDLTGSTFGYPKPLISSNIYYFQQKGNWYRETGGIHIDSTGGTYVNEITYGNNPHIGDGTYDAGYDYVDQYRDTFKRYVRGKDDEIFDVTAYSNKGFGVSQRKNIDNKKIWYKNNLIRDNYSTSDERLILNDKNFAIGFDGDKILQSFFYNNNETQKISNTSIGVYNHTMSDSDLDNIFVENKTGTTNIIIDGVSLSNNRTFKIHNNVNGNGQDVTVGSHTTITSGSTLSLKYNTTSGWSWAPYGGEEEFALIRDMVLPYIEQIIPSTTIFDFVLKDKRTAKWLLVDDYCDRHSTGQFNGSRILTYQNISYFDENSTGLDQLLVEQVEKDFGTGFTEYGNFTGGRILDEGGGYQLMEDGGYSLLESPAILTGFGRLIKFIRTNTPECPTDRTASWEITNII